MSAVRDTVDLTGDEGCVASPIGQPIDLCGSQDNGDWEQPTFFDSYVIYNEAGVPLIEEEDDGCLDRKHEAAASNTVAASAHLVSDLADYPLPPPHPSAATTTAAAASPSCSMDQDLIVAQLVSMGFEWGRAVEAAVRCSTVDGAMKYLLGDDSQEEPQRLYPCPICMDQYDISEMITLSCLHRMCVSCFVGFCTSKISEAQVRPNELCCPSLLDDGSHRQCGVAISIHELKAYLPGDVFEKYDRFSTRAFCETEKLRCCPKCNEWYIDMSDVLEIETLWCKIRCGNCHHAFCGKCGQLPHKNQPDQDVSCEAKAAWLESNSKGDESLSSYMKDNKLFPCPKCHQAAEWSTGCKFLYCVCKANFCALCGKVLTESQHYSHFQGGKRCTGPFGNHCLGMEDENQSSAPVTRKLVGVKAIRPPAKVRRRIAPVAVPAPPPPPVVEARNKPGRARGQWKPKRGRRK